MGSEGVVWKNLKGRGWECRLRGNGATQSATCCTMRKGVRWGLDTKYLRIVAAFWAGIPRTSWFEDSQIIWNLGEEHLGGVSGGQSHDGNGGYNLNIKTQHHLLSEIEQ